MAQLYAGYVVKQKVSMKSGLEGRNNSMLARWPFCSTWSLNEVRPRRPEQSSTTLN